MSFKVTFAALHICDTCQLVFTLATKLVKASTGPENQQRATGQITDSLFTSV